jgi:hypothetical protein
MKNGQKTGANGTQQLIRIHAQAPQKPVAGKPCNGCGLCCVAEPCPVSRFFLGHRDGSCPALIWEPAPLRYVCGMVTDPARFLKPLPRPLEKIAGRLFRRWIAADTACDFDAEVD